MGRGADRCIKTKHADGLGALGQRHPLVCLQDRVCLGMRLKPTGIWHRDGNSTRGAQAADQPCKRVMLARIGCFGEMHLKQQLILQKALSGLLSRHPPTQSERESI